MIQKIKKGTTAELENAGFRFGQAKHYHVAYLDGRYLLFTDHELEQAHARANMNQEDVKKVKAKWL